MPVTTRHEVRASAIAGLGVFATRAIRKGARVVEYLGERVTHDEVDARYDDEAMASHHTMVFSIDDTWCIDAARVGSDARFINHCCAPNCEAIQYGDRIFIVAREAVPSGAELTYDYQYVVDPTMTLAQLKRVYPCRCGASSCRGTIAAPREKPKSRKRR